MSILYAESNEESTKELYSKRTIYQGTISRAQNPNLVNFNQGEKYFYGRVDRRFVPINYAGGAPLASLKSVSSSDLGLKVLAFVADAFEDLAQQFEKCTMTGKIDPDLPFLSNLRAYKAYVDPGRAYAQYMETYFTSIANAFIEKNIQVKNFDEFIKELKILLKKSVREIPFTQPGYMKSKYCTVLANALTIEIADMDVTNDEKKVNDFLISRNWDFYVNTCNSYGFMVDRTIPWRIVADIASSPMLKYAANYGVGSTSAILERVYARTHHMYYPKFKFWLLKLYNRVKPTSILISENCAGSRKFKTITPKSYSAQSLANKYPESHFLKLYCDIRIWEEESKFEVFEKDILIDDTIELYHSTGIFKSLRKFEIIINKPFDYRGSLSYTRKQQVARENMEEP
tara:strand:+ start:4240 stop:5442 length:1203 start_codon:yes stop_codon:yes gene_type:complete